MGEGKRGRDGRSLSQASLATRTMNCCWRSLALGEGWGSGRKRKGRRDAQREVWREEGREGREGIRSLGLSERRKGREERAGKGEKGVSEGERREREGRGR